MQSDATKQEDIEALARELAKTVVAKSGPLGIETPRDRNGDFETQLVKKRQRRVTVIDDKIIPLYAKDMSTREIAATIEDLYGAESTLRKKGGIRNWKTGLI